MAESMLAAELIEVPIKSKQIIGEFDEVFVDIPAWTEAAGVLDCVSQTEEGTTVFTHKKDSYQIDVPAKYNREVSTINPHGISSGLPWTKVPTPKMPDFLHCLNIQPAAEGEAITFTTDIEAVPSPCCPGTGTEFDIKIDIPQPDGKIYCVFCDPAKINYDTREEFMAHLECDHGSKPSEKFYENFMMNSIEKTDAPLKSFACTICDYSCLATEKAIRHHLHTKHDISAPPDHEPFIRKSGGGREKECPLCFDEVYGVVGYVTHLAQKHTIHDQTTAWAIKFYWGIEMKGPKYDIEELRAAHEERRRIACEEFRHSENKQKQNEESRLLTAKGEKSAYAYLKESGLAQSGGYVQLTRSLQSPSDLGGAPHLPRAFVLDSCPDDVKIGGMKGDGPLALQYLTPDDQRREAREERRAARAEQELVRKVERAQKVAERLQAKEEAEERTRRLHLRASRAARQSRRSAGAPKSETGERSQAESSEVEAHDTSLSKDLSEK